MTTKTKKTEKKPVDIGTKVARVAREIKAKKKAAKAAKKPSLGERIEKVAKPASSAHEAAEKAMSGLDAAALVLREAKAPMNAKDIVAAIQGRGLASGLKGKTPHATIYAAMIAEIAKKGEASRFRRGEKKGMFEANR